MKVIPRSKEYITKFSGYNNSQNVPENGFCHTKNLSSEHHPILSTRGKRSTFTSLDGFSGMIFNNGLCTVQNTSFTFNGVKKGDVSPGEKQLVAMGAYVLIFPDKKYYNTATDAFGSLENTYSASSTVTYTLTDYEGTPYNTPFISDVPPEAPADGALWINTSSLPHTLNIYSSQSLSWSGIISTYVKISATGIDAGFRVNDGVTIESSVIPSMNSANVISSVGTGYIIVPGIIDSVSQQDGGLVIKRTVPDMDYVTQLHNRVWGCSSDNHEIYASKLADPFNWNCFEGLASDSYAVTIGDSDSFTGATSHLSSVIFFKEGLIIKIYGTKPSNFEVSTINARGVQKGCHKSIAEVNETLFYKSRWGVMAYDGGVPYCVSADIDSVKYHDACAGSVGTKYYISMADENGVYRLFVYDASKNIWMLEDETHAKDFVYIRGALCYVDNEGSLISVTGESSLSPFVHTAGTPEDSIEWCAITGPLGMYMPNKKYLSALTVRMSALKDSTLKVSISYDSSPVFREVFSARVTEAKKSFDIRLAPHRCDHFAIKLEGTGEIRLHTMCKTLELGGMQ